MRYLTQIACFVCFALVFANVSFAEEEAGKQAEEQAGVVMLSEEWGKSACEVWNNDPVLSEGLFESGWAENFREGMDFRIIEIYRKDCPDSPHVQLKFQPEDNKTMCVDSGPDFNKGYDFLMWASTGNWVKMGEGKIGPMGGMATGRLRFKGSMWEAMKNMGPFKNFLLLFGKIPADISQCN
ncbi:MAG TPA: sterol-binding protein [Nitrospirae bacterium]|nr:sterol-binding protein [Nitrospirota bacterium]